MTEIKNQPKFLTMLHEIADVMTQSAKDDSALEMDGWVKSHDDEHPCKTAACVMGHLAIARADPDEQLNATGLSSLADDLSDELGYAERKLTYGLDHISVSIWSSSPEGRLRHASKVNDLVPYDLEQTKDDTFNHLLLDNPSKEDVVRYVNHVIKFVETKTNWRNV